MIYLAGLLNVPRELYEAIAIEGANAWQRFRHVTLPLITPVIFFTLIMGIIDGFQYFDQAFVASNVASGQTVVLGQPQDSLLFYGLWLYEQAFRSFQMGYASAMAWVLFIATMVATAVLLLTSKGWVHYGGGSNSDRGTSEPARRRRRAPARVRRHRFLLTIANHAVLIAVSLMFVLPVVWILLTSLMTDHQALTSRLIPDPVMWSNFVTVFQQIDLLRYTWNTVLYAGITTIGVVVSCVPVAYAFSRIQWKGRNVVFLLVLSTLMLPVQITTVPMFVVWARDLPDWTVRASSSSARSSRSSSPASSATRSRSSCCASSS